MTDLPSYTIGFANISENIPFAVTVRESLEQAVAAHPNINLIIRDNDMDSQRAIANVKEFADVPVDLAIIYHIDERVGSTLGGTLFNRSIPIIAVDIPMPFSIFFGANNKQAGLLAGQELGLWIQNNWDSHVDKVLLLTEPRVLDIVKQRVEFGLVGLSSLISYSKNDVLYIDCGNQRAPSAERSRAVLERWMNYEHIAVIAFNEEAALGTLDAARELGCENNLAVVSQGAAELAMNELRRPGSRLVASTTYFPEKYGERLLDLALKMLNKEKVPRENYTRHICITRDNVAEFISS